MNLLFIGAHPDDLEILCAGTIARCVELGHTVWMAVATNGNVGSPTHSREEIAAIRRAEARKAAETLGAAGFIWMDEDDELLFDDRRTRLLFVDAMREAKAEVVIAHNPHDYHPDHITSSKLATDARILAGVRLIETDHPHLDTPPELFYMDSLAGLNFTPQYFIDISATYERKVEALHCHHSQQAWLREIFDKDLTDIARVQSAFRGLQAGTAYAEAFFQPTYWPCKPVPLPFMGPSRDH